MTQDQLNNAIKKEAAARAERDILRFKSTIQQALKDLGFSSVGYAYLSPKGRQIMTLLASDNPNKGWPSEIWTDRERVVTEEVMSTMNALQKLFIQKEIISENFPVDNGQ